MGRSVLPEVDASGLYERHAGEVRFETGSDELGHGRIQISQWTLAGSRLLPIERPRDDAPDGNVGTEGQASQLLVRIEMHRDPLFMLGRVIAPLVMIVVLSWSVFWMERSTLADRINVSFIGILTVAAYQVVVSDIMPQISYMTWMNGFLNVSFALMCATVWASAA